MISKRKFVLLLTFLITNTLFSISRGNQELIQPGSWIYDYLTAITLEQGNINLSDQSPISISELKMYLSECDYEKLSDTNKILFEKIQKYFNEEIFSFGNDNIALFAEPFFNLEGYYKTNDDLPFIYNYQKRKGLITIPAGLQFSDYCTLMMDIDIQENRGIMQHNDNYTNIPIKTSQFDISFPRNGYFSTGYFFKENVGINFQLGMGPEAVGRSLTGSIIQSEYFTGSSFGNFEIYSPNIKYNMNVTEFNVDKYMYTHRFEIRLLQKFSFAVQESILVYSPLELRYLNPLTIYHSYAPWLDYSVDKNLQESSTCAYLAFKAAYNPWKNFRIYALFAQDQFQTQYELKNWPSDTTPNAISFQLGTEAFVPLSEGFLHFWLEGSYTDPFMYIKQTPSSSLVRTYQENLGDYQIFYEWLGSPYGPDTIGGEFKAEYELLDRFSLGLSYLFLAKGEYSGTNIFTEDLNWGGFSRDNHDPTKWPYPNNDDYVSFEEAKRRQSLKTPSGIPEFQNTIKLSGKYFINNAVSFYAEPSYTFIFNNHNIKSDFKQGFEITIGTTIDFNNF